MKGRPFLGLISGFFFGLFGGITLFLFGVIPLDSHLLWILPIVGIVLGLLMATWAPFGRSGEPRTASYGGVSYAGAGDAAETSGTTIEQESIDVEVHPTDEPPENNS